MRGRDRGRSGCRPEILANLCGAKVVEVSPCHDAEIGRRCWCNMKGETRCWNQPRHATQRRRRRGRADGREERTRKLRYGGEKRRKEKIQAWISPIMAGEDFCCGFHIGFLGRCSVRGESPAMAVGGNDALERAALLSTSPA
jgi:hypothetical protein